jgi:hypothetical protein
MSQPYHIVGIRTETVESVFSMYLKPLEIMFLVRTDKIMKVNKIIGQVVLVCGFTGGKSLHRVAFP